MARNYWRGNRASSGSSGLKALCWQICKTFGLAGFSAVMLSGCLGSNPITDLYMSDQAVVQDEESPKTGNKAPPPIVLETYELFGSETPLYQLALTSAEESAGKPGSAGIEGKAKYYRNTLQLDIIRRSDELCGIHRAAILANSASVNFALGLTATILSGVSAAIGGEAAKTALSAASAIVTSGQAHLNAEFYQNILAAAIVKEIDKLRRLEASKMADKRKTSTLDYPVQEALVDVSVYHLRCSFFQGIVELTEEGQRRQVLTRAQIDAEIARLEKENAALEPKFTTASNAGSVKSAARRSWDLNNIRIEQLRQLRRTAPGTVKPETKAQGADEAVAAAKSLDTKYKALAKNAADLRALSNSANAEEAAAKKKAAASAKETATAKAVFDKAVTDGAADVDKKKADYETKKAISDADQADYESKKQSAEKLKKDAAAAEAKAAGAKAKAKAAADAAAAAAEAAKKEAEAKATAAKAAAAAVGK